MALEKTRKWLEETTGEAKTEDDAAWFLAYWTQEQMGEYNRKDMARVLLHYCEKGISTEDFETDFFQQMDDCKEEEEYFEEDWEGRAKAFYGS